MELIVTTPEKLHSIVKDAMIERENENLEISPPKLYSINHIAKMLGKAHATIAKLVKNGSIKTTADGLITEKAINDYLNC